jgi:hypothetical protein
MSPCNTISACDLVPLICVWLRQGNLLTTVVYAIYPRLLHRGGWKLVFRFYALMLASASGCIGAFTIMEARSPLVRSPLEPLTSLLKKRKP